MSTSTRRGPFGRYLIDLNTQCDFLLPRGALPVANRAGVLPNVRRLMNWARVEAIPTISTLESHRPGESNEGLPAYCVERTRGQRKLPFTLMPTRIVLCGDNTLDVPLDPFKRYQQLIFTKRDRDFLSNPKADRLIAGIRAEYLAVFGVLVERCVKIAVLGLLARRHRVIIVRDACGYWSAADAELAFRQMEAKGAVVATTEELISGQAATRLHAEYRPFTVADEREDTVVIAYTNDNGSGNGNGNGNGNANGNGNGHGKTTIPGFQPVRGNGKSDGSHPEKYAQAFAHLLELRQRKNIAPLPRGTGPQPGQPSH